MQALCVEAACYVQRNFFNMLQGLFDCLEARSLQSHESVAALTPLKAARGRTAVTEALHKADAQPVWRQAQHLLEGSLHPSSATARCCGTTGASPQSWSHTVPSGWSRAKPRAGSGARPPGPAAPPARSLLGDPAGGKHTPPGEGREGISPVKPPQLPPRLLLWHRDTDGSTL